MDQTKLEQLLKRCSLGESVQQLCKELKLSRNTVYAYCKRNSIILRSKFVYKPYKLDARKRQQIATEYSRGKSSTRIASKYKISHKTVIDYVLEFGFTVRSVDDNRKIHGNPAINAIINGYKMSAAAKKHGFNLSYNFIENLISQNCHYCGCPPSQTRIQRNKKSQISVIYNGIDRFNNLEGYYAENVVPSCFRCNSAKNDMPIDEFKRWLRRLIDHGTLQL